MKERECVKVVFEGGNLIQVILLLLSNYFVLSIAFYFRVLV